MTNYIIIKDSWEDPILHLAKQFNKYVKTDELKKITFTIDRVFKILTDDNNPLQYQAADLLKHIRAVNNELIPEYTSTLVDAKLRRQLINSKDFVIPDYLNFPFSQKPEEDEKITVLSIEQEDDIIIVEDEEDDIDDSVDDKSIFDVLLGIPIKELLSGYGFMNLEETKYDQINSKLKKCACGDGEFDENDQIPLWRCKECHTVYHENCAKVVAIFEGKCRICDTEFHYKKEESDEE